MRKREEAWEQTRMWKTTSYVPICVQTISVRAPMNWGVAFLFRRRQSSSTILPTANQRAALSCYFRV